MTSEVERPGSCLCRRVRFTVMGDPFDYSTCHCENCKKSGGSAFMTNAFFTPDKVILTEGQDLISKYDDKATTSGNTLTRHFCSNCGSCLFLNSPSASSEWTTLSPATVDGQEWVPRRYNCPDGKLSWVVELHMEPKDTV
ncbi:DUF636 domain-containing protein [Favolaschia claudopus]|uniref:DUF636 domain-containing protein n=1 Tax=Favolaschia claudopus TaxID=2862362 RepID=A0AAW0AID5_9AGAR